jgi:hypothetical protein
MEGSLLVFDKSANADVNLVAIEEDGHDHLTSKKLNKCDDKVFQAFDPRRWPLIDADEGTYALVHKFPSRINYYSFSSKLKEDHGLAPPPDGAQAGGGAAVPGGGTPNGAGGLLLLDQQQGRASRGVLPGTGPRTPWRSSSTRSRARSRCGLSECGPRTPFSASCC